MTTAPPAVDIAAAIVDGIDLDAVASAVQACPGVSDLTDGRFGDATSYLPGRRLTGVAVREDSLRISVRARWGVTASDLLDQITLALTPIGSDRRIEVVIAEIDDPPWLAVQQPLALPAGPDAPSVAGTDVVSPEGRVIAGSVDPPAASEAPAQVPPPL
jgi:hypothetical protein